MTVRPQRPLEGGAVASHVAEKQLTARALVAGAAIGAVLCTANVYVVLKTGWSLGVTLSSTIIGFGVFRALRAVGIVRRPLGVLENTTISSVASAAAFMTGGGNMAALPALVMLTGTRPSGAALFVWFAVIAAIGVLVAIPIKRQILDVERLPFPLGVATATTLRAMHGETEDPRPAVALFGAAGLAGVATLLRELRRLPGQFTVPITIAEHAASAWTLAVDNSLVLFGGGALMGSRTAWSMLLGALATYGVLAPAMVAHGVVGSVDYKAIVAFTLWPGAALLVVSGVFSLALQWRSAALAVRALIVAIRGPNATGGTEVGGEAPMRWFGWGLAALAPVAVLLMWKLFGIPLWAGAASIPLALVMGVVAGRVTGETDMSPTKAIGPVTQVLFGAMLPANVTANLMSANVTAGIGLHAGDLLTDMKAGQLVGAAPRGQVIAQFVGVGIGAAAVVPAFVLLVPSASSLGTAEFPAPAVLVWASVSKALSGGVIGLPPAAQIAAAAGATLGVALVALERRSPRNVRGWIPSPAGLGMAMVMPGSTTIAMFVGSMVGGLTRRFQPSTASWLTPVASGLVAGESVVGMAVSLARAIGVWRVR